MAYVAAPERALASRCHDHDAVAHHTRLEDGVPESLPNAEAQRHGISAPDDHHVVAAPGTVGPGLRPR
jgi:hypothetical protein